MARRTREELLKDLNQALRKVSAQSVLLSDAVARLAGLTSTDLECLDLLLLSGVTTAGALAAHTGLTTGAITAVIDRMERAGFARRQRDPNDRRRVLVEALPRYVQEIGPLYRGLAESTETLHSQYDDRQLALVVDYLSRAFTLAAEHVNWLQTQAPLAQRPALANTRLATGTSTAALTTPALPRQKPAPSKTVLSKTALSETAHTTGTSQDRPRAKAARPATPPTGHTGKWERIRSSDIEGSRARR
jgi:DNA-binding MarR family transcriptional regulator